MLTYRQERGDTDVQVKLLTKAFQNPMFLCFEYLSQNNFLHFSCTISGDHQRY